MPKNIIYFFSMYCIILLYHLMSIDEAAEELDVPVGSQLAEVAMRHVTVLANLSRLMVPSLHEPANRHGT